MSSLGLKLLENLYSSSLIGKYVTLLSRTAHKYKKSPREWKGTQWENDQVGSNESGLYCMWEKIHISAEGGKMTNLLELGTF